MTGGSTSGVAAGRPQPQTTVEAAGGPFIRHTQAGRRLMFISTGNTYSGVINQPMVASPGYNRGYRLFIAQTSGTGSPTVAADAPFSGVSLIQLKDAFGTPLITGPGYEMLFLLQLVSQQFGLAETQSVMNLPSYTYPNATGANYQYCSYLPFEFAKGYGVISGANASLLPTLQINLAASSAVGTSITGSPVVEVEVEADFYWLPEGVAIEPPGIGTTCQYLYQPANPTIATGATTTVQLPRLGGYLSTICMELRNASAARVSGWPAAGNRLRVYVDGVPLIDTDTVTLYDDMAIDSSIQGGYGGSSSANPSFLTALPTGVVNITRKTSLAQRGMGLFDTGETFLSTNPGTQIEVAGAPFGTISSGPATLNAIVGQVVPSGALIQGLPEI
jgi:hypothetical protein